MKKILFFLAVMVSGSVVMGQAAQNSYYNGNNGNTGQNAYYSDGHQDDHYQNDASYNHHEENVGHNEYYSGSSSSSYSGSGQGMQYSGSVTSNRCQTKRRVRWEYSSCGRYKYKVTEEGRYTPGRYVYRRGCRRWVRPVWNWRTICKTRYNIRRPGCRR